MRGATRSRGPVRVMRSYAPIFLSLANGIVSYFLLPESALGQPAFDLVEFGHGSFLVSIALMISKATSDTIRRDAALHDEGQNAILGLASIAILAAVTVQRGSVKESTRLFKAFHLGPALATILSAWAYIHVVFAL
jgi:uncharacterized membrane protein